MRIFHYVLICILHFIWALATGSSLYQGDTSALFFVVSLYRSSLLHGQLIPVLSLSRLASTNPPLLTVSLYQSSLNHGELIPVLPHSQLASTNPPLLMVTLYQCSLPHGDLTFTWVDKGILHLTFATKWTQTRIRGAKVFLTPREPPSRMSLLLPRQLSSSPVYQQLQ